MSRSGDGKVNTLDELGVPKAEQDRLTIQVYERDIAAALEYLTKATNALNKALGRNDKVKGGLVGLSASLSGLADVAGGLLSDSQGKREVVAAILGEVVEGKDEYERAVNARYKLKLAGIVQEATERQLKELKETK